MAIAGRVAIVPKGDWSADATYKRLDAVTHNNTLYFAKKNVPAGTVTSNTEYWSRSIVGSAVIVDDTMSDTSENPVQNKVIKKYADDTFRKKKIAELAGDGKTQYFKLCTLKIIAHYADTPFEITVRARGHEMLDRLCVLFKSVNTLDPDLSSFRVFGESGAWYITKIATSTWAIYGIKSEPWASVQVVDYTAYNNVTITWDMTGVASLPSSKTQASWGGKVRYADVAGNVVNNQTTTVAGFALDARQANPNIDGTLAKQLSDLNGSLERQEEKSCVLVNATGSASYIRNGFMVQVTMEITPTKLENGVILLKGLPRPAQTLYLSLPAINGNNIPCVLNYNGELVVYFRDETNSSISRIDHNFCYMYDQWN